MAYDPPLLRAAAVDENSALSPKYEGEKDDGNEGVAVCCRVRMETTT